MSSIVPGVDRLLDDYGTWVAMQRCSLCKQPKLHLIRYAEGPKDYFLACQRCDRTEGKA